MNNETVKGFAKLKNRSERLLRREFIAEGSKLCKEALRSGCSPVVLFTLEAFAEEAEFSAFSDRYIVSEQVLLKLCESRSPQGVAGIFKMREDQLGAAVAPRSCIILENIQDPGNFGTIVRTAESFGVDRVLTVGAEVDRYGSKVLRGSMGSSIRMDFLNFETPKDVKAYLAQFEIKLWAAVLDENAKPISDVSSHELRAVAIGNEGTGLSSELIGLSDGKLYIPMSGRTDSLNAAIAAGIVMWVMQSA